MTILSSFADELVKISAEVEYRSRHGVQAQKGIPIIRKLPKDREQLAAKLEQLAKRRTKTAPLGYSNVAIPEDFMPHPEALGFTKTRIATPLPGESPFTASWRKGKLHIHKQGPAYLLHADEVAPMGRLGYMSPKAVVHGLKEGVPSLVRRIRERQPLVKSAWVSPLKVVKSVTRTAPDVVSRKLEDIGRRVTTKKRFAQLEQQLKGLRARKLRHASGSPARRAIQKEIEAFGRRNRKEFRAKGVAVLGGGAAGVGAAATAGGVALHQHLRGRST